MSEQRNVKDVFDAWGRERSKGMESEHWPRVSQVFEMIEPSSGNYLEVGVGNGYGLAYMATHQFAGGRCTGIDISDAMVEQARERARALENVEVLNGDFLTWDFAATRYDTIFSMEVFYYFKNIQDGIEKAFSILGSGGSLWVAVNFYEENEPSRKWPEMLGTHMHRWSAADYVKGFEKAGFHSIEQRMISGEVPEDSPHGDAPTLLTFGARP